MRAPLLVLGTLSLGTLSCATSPRSAPPVAASGPTAAVPAPAEEAEPEDPAAAIPYFEKKVAGAPRDAETWRRLASSLRQVNRLQEAARAGWRAVELDASWQAWNTLGNVLMQGQARQGAWAAFEMAAQSRMDPDDVARSFLNLGYQDWALGTDDLAGKAVDRAEKASPDNVQVHYDRASLLAAGGRRDDARRSAQRALALLDQLPEAKLPTAEARDALQVMRRLLEGIIAGQPVERPPLNHPAQDLPVRFWRDKALPGEALALTIDPDSYRIYPAGSGRLFRIKVPSRWNETTAIQPTSTDVKLTSDAATPATVVQITALLPQRPVDLREATENGAQLVRKNGGRVEQVQPLPGGGGFWFWSIDPAAKPNDPHDYPFLGQAFVSKGGVLLSTTLLARADTAETRKLLIDLVESAGTLRVGAGQPPKT